MWSSNSLPRRAGLFVLVDGGAPSRGTQRPTPTEIHRASDRALAVAAGAPDVPGLFYCAQRTGAPAPARAVCTHGFPGHPPGQHAGRLERERWAGRRDGRRDDDERETPNALSASQAQRAAISNSKLRPGWPRPPAPRLIDTSPYTHTHTHTQQASHNSQRIVRSATRV